MHQNSTQILWHIDAPREKVYNALIDVNEIQKWRVPSSMKSHIHYFDPSEGGSFRISLTYNFPTNRGKSTAHTDTYNGSFIKLIPNTKIIEVDEFETTDPNLQGRMTITITLKDSGEGTDILAVHDNLPNGILPEDNELGWREALSKLTELLNSKGSEQNK